MKNNVMPFFCATMLLLLGSSFVNQPVSGETTFGGAKAIFSTPYGGAYVVFAGKFGGEVTKQEMAGQTEVKVEGCAKGSRIFDITLILEKGGQTITLKSDSGVLTKEMRANLNSLVKGDSFEFKNTKAYLPNTKDVVDVHGRKFIVV